MKLYTKNSPYVDLIYVLIKYTLENKLFCFDMSDASFLVEKQVTIWTQFCGLLF